jgi:superfamily II DNA or RNA helicase
MIFEVTQDKNFLILKDSTALELEQLESSFTKRVDNYWIIKKKVPHWDGEIRFIDKWHRIPLGLWGELKKMCKEYNFSLKINGKEHLYDEEFDTEKFYAWLVDHFSESPITPRYYQIEGAKRVIKYRRCTEEISTSGGKTLIAYIIFRYLLDRGDIKKMLYIVPNINLVTQSEDKFIEYEEGCKKDGFTSTVVFGGAKRRNEDSTNIVFGTYQSLVKKDLEYFQNFDAVMVDETHHASSNSIRKILVKCTDARFKFGLTGTLPKEGSCDSFTIQAFLGPKVYTIHSSDLITEGNATPVHVICIELDYLDNEVKRNLYDLRNVPAEQKDGARLLNMEKDIARDSRKRFNFICETIEKSSRNSLVIFSDIKNDYGRRIYDWLRENTNKNAYYIDGGTKDEHRDYYKKKMEDEEETILVASVGTFSEGIDINNLYTIYIVESFKSEKIVRQTLGRGMRLMNGKEKVTVIDFSDNYEHGSNGYQRKNYLLRHAKERQNIYKEKKFPYKIFRKKL